MSKDTNDKDTSDLEREFEEELKKEKRPEESLLPEEEEFEKEYAEEIQEELPQKKELDPYAEKFYALSTKKIKTEAELNNAVNKILNEIEHDYFFKGLVQKTTKGGKLLLQKGLKTFKGIPAFQAANAITQMVRGNLKVTFGTLAKTALKGMQAGTTSPTLKTLGFEAGNEETEQNREAWQNFTNVCKESFDYLARNLNENADDPLEASKLSSEAFSAAVKKVESERKSAAAMQKARKLAVAKPTTKKIVDRKITLALGLICIVLAASLVGAIAYYAPIASNVDALTAEIKENNNTISTMNNTISTMSRQITALQSALSQITLNQSSVSALNAQISALTSIVNLNVSVPLVSNQVGSLPAGSNYTVFDNVLEYAGYVTVDVQSNSTTTYAGVIYNSHGIKYVNNITVGTSGEAAFPILPGSVVIIVGNTETDDNLVSLTVTATYYY